MKLALLYGTLSQGGGTYQLLELATQLSYQHEVTIFALSDETNGVYHSLTHKLTIITYKKEKRNKKGKVYNLFSSFINCYRLRKLVLRNWNSYDVLNPHEWNNHWAAVLIKLQKKCKVVWMCNDVWHIPGYEELPEKRILFKLFNSTLIWWADFFLTSLINSITVLDYRIQSIIKEKYNKNAIVIRSGFDSNRFNTVIDKDKARKSLKIDHNKVVFLCFSIFFRHRRFEDVIEAYRKVVKDNSNTLLIIAGSSKFDTEYFNAINGLISQYLLNASVLVIDQFVSDNEKHLLFSASDIFIYPNERQTWGIAVVEAMASKNVVIVSNGAGVHEVIEDGENGFIYNCGDVNELYTLMLKALKSKKQREIMGTKAYKYVLNNLSWEKYSTDMESVFRKK